MNFGGECGRRRFHRRKAPRPACYVAGHELRAFFLALVDLSTIPGPPTTRFEPLNWLIGQPTGKTEV
jgi:hypothetical protein